MSSIYLGSLLYLSLMGTIASFACYYTLIRKIGPEKSAYSATLYPVFALMLSRMFEGYEWTYFGIIGFILILWGNVLVLSPRRAIRTIIFRQ